jgi:hydroxymethylglutaryl-CoA reductase
MKFYQLSTSERREELKTAGYRLIDIPAEQLELLNQFSENVIGGLTLPLGLVQNLVVNGQKWLVPLATEEPSVVAAANHGAKVFAQNGGVTATSSRPGVWGQIWLKSNSDFSWSAFQKRWPAFIKLANQKFASLVGHGGGVRNIVGEYENNLVKLRVLIDPAQAMGANKVNSICEFLAAQMAKEEDIAEKLFAIVSNYPSQFAHAEVSLKTDEQTGQKMALLSRLGDEDPYRAITNNKGILNSVEAILLATGNDTRAVALACGLQAGQHSLSKWVYSEGMLHGSLRLPLALGVVGGSIGARPDVAQNMALLGQPTAAELAKVIAACGLASNWAALNAIATAGIQAGHMKLQARATKAAKMRKERQDDNRN